MKFLLFGTGDYYQRYKQWINREDIVALIDNNPAKQGEMIDYRMVIPPQKALELEFDYIIILSFYVKSMRQQLVELGVDNNKILHFFELYKLNLHEQIHRPIEVFGSTLDDIITDKSNSVLLLSTDLELQGGPATSLIKIAEILKKNGRKVVFGTMIDGPRRDVLVEKHIPVVVDARLQICKMKDIEWVQGFSHIICNTVGYCVFVSERACDTPITWWLHDSSFFYDGVERELLETIDYKNVNLISVGKIPRMAFNTLVPNVTIGDFLYGIEEKKSIVRFMVMGYVEKRKGQDILVEAIKRKDRKYVDKAIFYFVGKDTSIMADELKRLTEDNPEIVFTGMVSEEEKDRLFSDIDVLVCPSREDPMPAVVTEAMMHKKVTIVSSATGIADYIDDGIDGFVFESENAENLKNKIEYCIDNKDKLESMGNLSRGIFDRHFSFSSFEKRILEQLASDC